jgi:NADH-quinone oxidoreductase subunit E
MENCCCNKTSALKAKAQEIINITGAEKEKTIPILQEIQRREGYLPEDLLNEVSNLIGIAISDFYGVATFYSQFRFVPLGKYLIKVCNGTACYVSGTDLVYDAIAGFLDIQKGETTQDKLFTLETVACLGCCSLAPVVMIDSRVYGKQTPDSIRKILDGIKKSELQNRGLK